MIKVYVHKKVLAPASKLIIEKIVKLAAKHEKKIKGEVEVYLVSKSEIKKLNRHYRGINKPTDVLSFAWKEMTKQSVPKELFFKQYLGEIFLCPEYIGKQSKRFKVTKFEEFKRMLIHGLLHLVGYDHDSEKKAKKMFSLQETLVKLPLI